MPQIAFWKNVNWLIRLLFLALAAVEVLAWHGFIFHIVPDYSWLGLMLTVGGVWLLTELIDLSWPLRLTVFLATVLDASSDMFHLYSRFLRWDEILHFIGGGVAAVVAAWVLQRAIRNGRMSFARPAAAVFIGAVLIAAFLGMLYEVEEYLTDIHYLHYQKQLGDGPDTVDDELFNIYGAIVLGGAYAWGVRKKHPAA